MAQNPASEGAAEALEMLRQNMQTMQLSTVSTEGEPHCGYTPFLLQRSDIFIFVSRLSLHTRDLLATPRAGVMIIADEQASSQIFARTRVSYQCAVSVWQDVWSFATAAGFCLVSIET